MNSGIKSNDKMKDVPYHFYLGQQAQVRKKNDKDREYLVGRICEVTSGSNHGDWIKVWFDDCHTVTNDTWNELTSNSHHYFIGHDEIKLVLRRLSDMSEEEAKECWACAKSTSYRFAGFDGPSRSIFYKNGNGNRGAEVLNKPQQFHYLLSKSFDLFGLIDSGLAIDAKTLQTKP
jgi:hypothetical protein